MKNTTKQSVLKKFVLVLIVLTCSVGLRIARAQGELAATLEVISAGVEVLRANTVNWLPVRVEAIVGVGDTIRTDATGEARITFFADGTETDVLPNSSYRIVAFEGDDARFRLEAEVLIGQTRQRLNRLLDGNSSYDIQTPGISMAARGTEFDIRVEQNGRSAMLVFEGEVSATERQTSESAAQVAPGFGIRADADAALSDVVQASNFAELDAALDGCPAVLTTPDDVSLNVRIGPGRDFPKVGTLEASDITVLVGETETSGWYRIMFRGGFGWVFSSTASIERDCAGLRQFPDDYGPEDVTRYTSLGDDITLEDLQMPSEGQR